jgi:hypothetical protein
MIRRLGRENIRNPTEVDSPCTATARAGPLPKTAKQLGNAGETAVCLRGRSVDVARIMPGILPSFVFYVT